MIPQISRCRMNKKKEKKPRLEFSVISTKLNVILIVFKNRAKIFFFLVD